MGEKSYQHFLITRFNLKGLANFRDIKEWELWNTNRFHIFKTYTLPSVLNQSNKDFIWLIFFDKSTPVECLKYIDALKQYKFIVPKIIQGINEFNTEYIKSINRYLNKYIEWIITTRIDNDDCIHQDMVDIIQHNFQPKHGYMISLASGYTLDIRNLQLSHYFYPMSPFISLIESTQGTFYGIFKKRHTEWLQLRLFVLKEIYLEWVANNKRSTRFILNQPLWIQTIHGNNVCNSFYRGIPVTKSKSLKTFGLNFSAKPNSLHHFPKYYNYVFWKRYLKCLMVKWLIRK